MVIAYGSVVDYAPKRLWEALALRRALTEIAGADPAAVTLAFHPAVPERTRAAIAGPCRATVADGPRATLLPRLLVRLARGADSVALLAPHTVPLVLFPALPPGAVAGIPQRAASPTVRDLDGFARAEGYQPISTSAGPHPVPRTVARTALDGSLLVVAASAAARIGTTWEEAALRLDVTGALSGFAPEARQTIALALALHARGVTPAYVDERCAAPASQACAEPVDGLSDRDKFDRHHDASGHLIATADVASRPERLALRRIVDDTNEADDGMAFATYRRFRHALKAREFARAARLIAAFGAMPHASRQWVGDMAAHRAAVMSAAGRAGPVARMAGRLPLDA